MIEQGLNAMGRLVADIIVETLQRQGVVGDTLNLIARSSRGVVCKSWRCGTPYRFAAQYECDQASLPWADRDCSTRGSYRLCP
jgi:hypothetical protein